MGCGKVISAPSMDVDLVRYTTLDELKKRREKKKERLYNNDFTTLDPY
jgi:hypothetical protein